ncbi:hypothetical protein A1D23_03790 [Chelonobacter oris]|uniref:hypothetical protein n=1 Tax=Chelonobacter oris TaxID=505317 RepID=UPI00244A463B|nr:hypothetical protein [Chelonobacter oris]MDH2999227.1 hypothetical protein [Chelonobacter oris]
MAYLVGHAGAFRRFNNEKGEESPCGIWDYWYTAKAADEDGNDYKVVWEILDKDAGEEGCCDWERPTYIEDSTGRNMTDTICLNPF